MDTEENNWKKISGALPTSERNDDTYAKDRQWVYRVYFKIELGDTLGMRQEELIESKIKFVEKLVIMPKSWNKGSITFDYSAITLNDFYVYFWYEALRYIQDVIFGIYCFLIFGFYENYWKIQFKNYNTPLCS